MKNIPPTIQSETQKVLKKATFTHCALVIKLNGVAKIIPNFQMLINSSMSHLIYWKNTKISAYFFNIPKKQKKFDILHLVW